MGDIKLNSNDYMAITRAMDINKNNRIDPSEATISRSANLKIGNANGIAGTKETASSLEQGEVFIPRFNRDAANNIAIYFSDRTNNEGKQVKDWTSDNWISKEDLQMSDSLRRSIDTNGDNRISRAEFADALVDGKIVIGGNVPSVPSTPPAQKPSNMNNDPFSGNTTKPSNMNNDPFSGGSSTRPTGGATSDPFSSKPATSNTSANDPFSRPTAAQKPANTLGNDPFGRPAAAQRPTNNPYSNPFGN